MQKSAIQVDPGNTKLTGQTFGYRLTYRCNATVGNCLNAVVTDVLPAEVVFVSAVATSDVASTSTPSVGSTGTVTFTMISPLPAGNSGDLIVNVRFPNGSTPNGTVATNTATGTNLATPPGNFTTPPVSVTAVASPQISLSKTLLTSPANLDMPESYRLRIAVSGNNGSLNLTAVGPVVDTLPAGVIFNGATPAADCEPGCVGTTPATLTWTSPCSLPVPAGGSCDITVNVTFPSATFPSGTNVTNSFTAAGTPLGQPANPNLGVGSITHPVTTFVPNPSAALSKGIEGNSPNPPTLDQTFRYQIGVSNNGNVALDNLVVTDTLPIEMLVANVTTGSYSGLSDFGPGVGVRVSYEKNTAPGVFTLWGSSPNTTTNTTLTSPPPGLGAGEYLTRIRWESGSAAVGMSASSSPLVTGQITNPDRAGGPVAFGDTIMNCVDLSAVYTPGPTNVTRNACNNFTLSGPFVQLNPAKENLSGGPFLPGNSVAFRLRVRSAPQSSDPAPLQFVVSTDLLPVDLLFSTWTFDDRGTGLPAPQVFDQIPNFAGTGRTLLRWRWNAGSGNLGVGQEVWINISTMVRSGAFNGNLSNDFTLEHDAPGLGQRCSGSSQADPLDLDADADTAETLCRGTGTIAIAPVAQLVSNKRVQGDCDAGFSAASLGTLFGGAIDYRLLVQNVGTIPMNNFVIVDILPFVGDTGVLDTNPRNSLWAPILTAPIVPPPGTTIYYSLSGNPCRPEVGGPNSGCDPPNWTTSAPVPVSLARSFKVEFGARTIQPFDFLTFDFRMTVPAGAPTGGAQAFNSFAYLGARADGIGNLSAEPNKVGVSIGTCPAASLGDFVWLDTNRNGLQDDGATGVNGVFAELLAPGVDGIARTADDVLVSTTVTADDVSNNPGWYQFPGLAAGNYFVRFTPPPNLEVTLRDAGSDTADSDVDAVTACSPVVVLGPTDSNQDVDMGLVPPVTAALGDYVFWDLDNDGIQDGPADLGVNGVAVKLFADNGNGTPEPGGPDGAPVAIVVTANDVYGQPGYYLFENLLPGVKYFVQFMLPPTAAGFTLRDAGGDDAQDSDADTGNGTSPLVMLMAGETNRSIDAGLVRPAGSLRLGNQVWMDTDDDGLFEPQDGEMGIDGVRLDLYRDANGDGMPTLDEYLSTTSTLTANGFAGRYEFAQLAPGNYLVVVPSSNFLGSEPLAGKQSSTGNDPAPDPDDDVNGDDNGTPSGALVASRPVTLSSNGEPTIDGDSDANSNLTVDFGFAAGTTSPQFDYGDDPDVVAGAFSPVDYQTTALDSGAAHRVGVANAPYLGSCVDADPGTQQSTAANADDANSYGTTVGACAAAGDDEDGVSFTSPLRPGSPTNFTVTAGSGTSPCVLSAWIDWNRDGDFLDVSEQIATAVSIPSGTTTNLNSTVPANARPGFTYSRFRCASAAVAGPTGMAPDGEVEDYRVAVVGMDFGDAPDGFGTTLGANGPRHDVDPNLPLTLGSCEDTESDGAPGATALGDDNAQGNPGVGLCFDDEDGVSIPMIVACQSAAITVTVGGAAGGGRLDAWIDWNRNGTIEITEPIATNLAVVPGVNVLNVSVPCDASPGTSYARFRLSTAGNLPPTGAAADGEVEDYAILIKGSDWGDAPAPYPTLQAANGPNHGVDPAAPRFLGSCVDTEANGQPTAPADGDDLAAGPAVGACTANDDEDGVVFSTPLTACQTATVVVTANVAGRLDAWIDWNRDGDWLDAGEQIAANVALAAGANPLALSVPCGVSPGATYARFRTSSVGGLGIVGAAMDGEVEDHRVTLRGADFGDLPDTFGTTFAAGGPNHGVDVASTLRLGACVDTEIDGQPSAFANFDDSLPGTSTAGACTLEGDEDGVIFLDVRPAACQTARLLVTTGAAGLLDGWFDFDGNGSFGAGEQIFDDRALPAGGGNLTFTVPCSAVPGLRGARFRFSSAGVVGPGGPSPDGEIEDYVVNLKGVDFGDAPNSYGTTFAANGPNHGVDPFIPLFLGSCVDTETDAGTPLDATGDDATAGPPTGTCAGGADDENGVTFTGRPSACKPFSLSVAANAAGRLDAWIDWNRDSDFLDANEQIAASRLLAAGPNPITLDVPCDAVEGATFARFRFSSAGGLSPTGPAPNGEVEDYALLAQGSDLGDAPNSYGTTVASGGPIHGVNPTTPLLLGSCVDTEDDAATPLDATGDDGAAGDQTVGSCAATGDDEDGVSIPMLIACQTATITATANAAGRLDAWIDWNRDGDFADAGERIATQAQLSAGGNALSVAVPCATVAGPSFSRFRFSSAGVAGSGGPSPDGEVEDYAVTQKAVDFGDLPDGYGTTIGSNGANHGVLPGFSLGSAIDGEPDGQPSPGADGDDLNGVPDDEDGVSFNTGAMAMVTACGTTSLTVTLTAPVGIPQARLDGWVDYDGDGTFSDPRDRVATGVILVPGPNTLSFTAPCDARSVASFARFRMSTTGVALSGGPAMDGEVEDYRVVVKGLDFGDAPDPAYPTLLASDGARHPVLPTGNPTLGSTVDVELDGQPSASHNGDDTNGTPDDEDGVSFPAVLIPGTDGTMHVTTGTTGGNVSAWIDWNQDGDWSDAGEQVATDVALGASAAEGLTFPVPVGSLAGTACVRVRISSGTGLAPTGLAIDGEVEDHLAPVGVEDPAIGVAKRLVSQERVDATLFELRFEIRVENLGNVPLSSVQATADLATAFAAAASYSVVSVTSPDLTVNGGFTGGSNTDLLAAGNSLGVGGSGIVTLVVRVDTGGETGPYTCTSRASGISPAGVVVIDDSEDGGDPDPDGDGDPGNNGTPTVFVLISSVVEIPTLDQYGLVLLALMLFAGALIVLRRRA